VLATAISWGGARVADGTLTVELDPAPDRAWTRRFRRVIAMLDRSPGEWEAIELHRGAITLTGVREGAQEKLRHLLESAIVEVSGDLHAGGPAGDRDGDEQRARDLRMTEAFRSLAAEHREGRR